MADSWTVDGLDALANLMLPVAADLICRVRDRDPQAVASLIAPMDPIHLRALVVVLAAMVPDDAHLDDLIAWTRTPSGGPLEVITPKHAARNRAALAREIGAPDDYAPPQKGAAA